MGVGNGAPSKGLLSEGGGGASVCPQISGSVSKKRP